MARDPQNGSSPQSLKDCTRNELYKMAQARGVDGRSSMTKQELRLALRNQSNGKHDSQPSAEPDGDAKVASRVGNFRNLAQARARGEFLMSPRMLPPEARRLHVRQTLREDHQERISRGSEDAQIKFDKLAGSLFSFFRGTALLFYRDMAGEDSWMPTVLTLGDVHPENFGVMPNANNVPFFSINDFDEAYFAPFTWDLKRGAVGFMIAAEEEGGYGRKKQRKIAKRFVQGYVNGVRRFAQDDSEHDHELRIDNAPPLIRELIEDALEDREKWLADKYLDEFKAGFRSNHKLVPISQRREEFEQLLKNFVKANHIKLPDRVGKLHVKDVAVRRGQGTASLGLPRYYLLLEGPLKTGADDIILEIKAARRSALEGLAAYDHDFNAPGDRIALALRAQLVRGDIFYGALEFEGRSFMVRERAPYRDDIDLDDLSKSEWKEYAAICGESLAHAHALSDEVGDLQHDAEAEIIKAIGDEELFVDDILRFAVDATDRLRADHEAFKADHAMNAFRFVDRAFK